MLNVSASKCEKVQTRFLSNWRSILTWNVCYRSCVFIKRFGLVISFNCEIVTKRPPYKCFKTFGVTFFILALVAISFAVVNCKTSFMHWLSVMCNALWERFKMVDDRKMVSFFKILYIYKVIHKELLYQLRIWVEK